MTRTRMESISRKKNYKKNKPDSDSDSDSTFVSESESEDYSQYDSSEIETPKSKKGSPKKSKKTFSDNSSENSDDLADLHKTLHELFPSKYMSKKVSDDERIVEKKKKRENEREKEKEREREKRKEKERNNRHKKSKKYESESDEIDSEDEEDVYEDIDSNEDGEVDEDNNEDVYEDIDSDEDDEDQAEDDKNFKITFTIGGQPGMKNKVLSNLSNDDYGSDDEETFMKETYENMEPVGLTLSTSCNSFVSNQDSVNTPKSKKKRLPKIKEDVSDTMSEVVDIGDKYKEIIELKKILVDKLKLKPSNKIAQKALRQCDHSIIKLIKNARSKNAKTYEDLLNQADNQETTDELGYFKKKLSNKEQLQIMNDLNDINKFMYVEKPYRLSLLQSNMPPKFKAIAIQRLNQLSMMEPGEAEYFKLKNWVDNFMRIPFGIYKNLTININDGIDKCSEYVVNAKKQLDTCVFGLNDAKMQIMQMVGQWISNPQSMGTAIAIHGPAGTGKTSLVKDGISKILGREFAFIALGGCGDSSFLEGHSYTYEGSTWGKIAQIMIESKCMNPVIYFDELDKVSDSARGQEIIGILTHLTDTTQNNQFHDKYFSEIDMDLSKCLFIFSYNDEKLVNPILKDRMYRINTKGYDLKEKITIARNYMLPKIREQVGFNQGDVVISDDVLSHMISNQAKGEEGVRNLKRTLEIIHTKLNLYRLVKPDDTGIFEKDMGLKVTFPHVLTKKDVDTLVKMDECSNQSVLNSMYV